ncbi:MAG TPA: hypothetical protein DCS93_15845 [Microscillaceae bacterium]|nr:hypothetical protein [Microscillaceae bacterium]
MKHYKSYSQSEHAVQRLWDQFTRRNEEPFWQQYEALLAKHQRTFETTSPPPAKPVIQEQVQADQVTKPPLAGRKESFGPAPIHYLVSLSMGGIFILITILFARTFTTGREGDIGFLLIAYLIVFVFYVSFSIGVNEFKTDQRYLYVHKPLLFFSLYEKWDNIQSIIIEKDLSGEGGISQTLTIKTYQRTTQRYTYKLLGDRHEEFMTHLEKKIPDVQFRVKCISNVGFF